MTQRTLTTNMTNRYNMTQVQIVLQPQVNIG